jgi:hypothetical protein
VLVCACVGGGVGVWGGGGGPRSSIYRLGGGLGGGGEDYCEDARISGR